VFKNNKEVPNVNLKLTDLSWEFSFVLLLNIMGTVLIERKRIVEYKTK
jgi:hypothetical protein